ncbi:hypothetical protein D2Q93_04375 [Alicyclobacillaceae bacterium I2511]|nr:hypothetical protein D2Q93_04375 [Alicyclobacillaceae bacterium I2511]
MVGRATGWASSPNQIFRTTTSGEKWVSVLKSSAILTMDAVTSKTAWVVTQDGAHDVILSYTHDGGVHWATHTLHASWPVAQAQVNVATHSADGSFGSVLLSGPVGMQTGPQALWTISQGHVSSAPVYTTAHGAFAAVAWISSTRAWAISDGASSPALMDSMNGGASWSPVALPLPSWVSPKAMNNPRPQLQASLEAFQPPTFVDGVGYLSTTLNVPYIGSQNIVKYHHYAVLYKTTRGTIWKPIWTRANASVVSLDWITSQDGWDIVAKGHQVQLDHTATSGHTWQDVFTVPSTIHPLSVKFFSQTGWIVSQSTQANTLSLWQSHNNGKQWQVVHE